MRKKNRSLELGRKVGTKRADRRWQDAKGELWASRFESLVYEAGIRANLKVRKCSKGGDDTVAYRSKVLHGVCESCKSTDISQERRYTPDLCVIQDPQEGSAGQPSEYYVETKGYLRGPQRSLLRSLCKAGAIADLRFILQSNYRATAKLTLGEWISKYLNCKWAVWDGKAWPSTWNQNEPKKVEGPKTGAKRVRKAAVQREGSE